MHGPPDEVSQSYHGIVVQQMPSQTNRDHNTQSRDGLTGSVQNIKLSEYLQGVAGREGMQSAAKSMPKLRTKQKRHSTVVQKSARDSMAGAVSAEGNIRVLNATFINDNRAPVDVGVPFRGTPDKKNSQVNTSMNLVSENTTYWRVHDGVKVRQDMKESRDRMKNPPDIDELRSQTYDALQKTNELSDN